MNAAARVLTGLWVAACAAHAEPPRAGLAAVDITPPLGIPLAGYYHTRGADGILDPLYCKVLVLESAGARAAWITLDLIKVPRAVTDVARAEIARTCGMPPDHVLLCATHTHTAPVLATGRLRDAGTDGPHPAVTAYTAGLSERIVAGVRQALDRLQPARLHVARVVCDDLTFNRRYILRDGSVGWNPGKLNPDIVRPAGPHDPEVGVLYLEPPDATGPQQGLATWVNFALHTDTTGGTRISADWPGALARVLAGYHGPDHQTLVAPGACGNLNHLDFAWRWPQTHPRESHPIATLLGAVVLRAYKHLRPVPPAPLRARRALVELDLPAVTEAEVERARQTVATLRDDRRDHFLDLVRAPRILDVAARGGRPHRVEVQALAWGRELAWVGLPGEVFAELGLAIKQRSPFPDTFVISLANENVGYVPDRRSYWEGHYEPESARCAPGSGERLVEVAWKLLAELYE